MVGWTEELEVEEEVAALSRFTAPPSAVLLEMRILGGPNGRV